MDELLNLKPSITPLTIPSLAGKNIKIDVLRLDLLHKEISGNKWYKLYFNIRQAIHQGYQSILSFGGSHSNHLHALAYAGFKSGLSTVGILRGHRTDSPTIQDCMKWGMQIHCMERDDFDRTVKAPESALDAISSYAHYVLPLGGDNELGIKGCEYILKTVNTSAYHVVVCAVGTGTTLIGLLNSFHGRLIGFMSSADNDELRKKIEHTAQSKSFLLIDKYKFGGFGKHDSILLAFMKDFQQTHHIELDKVYTAKAMYGLMDMAQKDELENGSQILFIHTGGLQGNRSLALP